MGAGKIGGAWEGAWSQCGVPHQDAGIGWGAQVCPKTEWGCTGNCGREAGRNPPRQARRAVLRSLDFIY